MGNEFKFLTESQIFKLKNMLLTEASAISLHQQFDKVYGSQLIDLVLSIDNSNKKKFAEWVLKSSLNYLDGDEIKNDFIADGTLKRMYDLTSIGKFQAMSYNNLKSAYDAMLEYEDANCDTTPAYDDGVIVIYVPSSYKQLQGILKRVYGKTIDKTHWCVASSSANEYWPGYTNHDEYHIYLIYNKQKDELFLWNDNPQYSYKMFNDWNDTPCSPMEDGQLTDKACGWLENHSGEASIYDVYPGAVKSTLLDREDDNLYVIDRNEDDLYYHDIDLYSSDMRLICSSWCYSNFDVVVETPYLAIVRNDNNDDYSMAWYENNGEISTLSFIDSYDEYNDYYFFINDDEIIVYQDGKGEINRMDKDKVNIGYSIYNFKVLSDKVILINDILYDCSYDGVILNGVEDFNRDKTRQNIVYFIMNADYNEYDVSFIDFNEEDIEYNDQYDSWTIAVDISTGEILSVIAPE